MKIFFTKSIPSILIDNQNYFEINDLRACIYARNAFLPSNRFFRQLLGDNGYIKRVVFIGQIVKVVNLTGLFIILSHSKVLKFNNSDSLLSEVTNLFEKNTLIKAPLLTDSSNHVFFQTNTRFYSTQELVNFTGTTISPTLIGIFLKRYHDDNGIRMASHMLRLNAYRISSFANISAFFIYLSESGDFDNARFAHLKPLHRLNHLFAVFSNRLV